MGKIGEIIVGTARRSLKYGELLVGGLTPDIVARKPQGYRDGRAALIDTNHPAFVFGHLGLYPSRLWTLRGKDPAEVLPPPAWTDVFKGGTACVDDPSGKVYPKWDEIMAHYRRVYDSALAVLPTLDDEYLTREHPDPKVRETFATIGMAVNFYYNNHLMMHFGQVSAWRRCFGLPGVM